MLFILFIQRGTMLEFSSKIYYMVMIKDYNIIYLNTCKLLEIVDSSYFQQLNYINLLNVFIRKMSLLCTTFIPTI